MELICTKCGCVNEYRTELKNNQNTAWCTCCGSFIKNIPYAKPALYFGKFKGRTIESMTTKEEAQYLNWLITSDFKLNPSLEKHIRKHLNIN
jgi:hypothetical protein